MQQQYKRMNSGFQFDSFLLNMVAIRIVVIRDEVILFLSLLASHSQRVWIVNIES